MKKSILYSLSLFICLCVTAKIHEWNPALYALGNKTQYVSALFFLEQNNIAISNKRILDVGCGTGEITFFLAQKAQLVHGFDASENMIIWAQEHYGDRSNNISFEHNYVEDFYTQEKYNLATVFFCFHWFADKQKALNNIARSLEDGGELFGTFSTSDTHQNPGIAIIKDMMKEWNIQEDFNQGMARSIITTQELKEILINAQFDIIVCTVQKNDIYFTDRMDIEHFVRPILMSRPFIQKMSFEDQERFLDEYVDRMTMIFQKNNAGEFTHTLHTTIVHARKKASLS